VIAALPPGENVPSTGPRHPEEREDGDGGNGEGNDANHADPLAKEDPPPTRRVLPQRGAASW
jgi:hypothetical protein